MKVAAYKTGGSIWRVFLTFLLTMLLAGGLCACSSSAGLRSHASAEPPIVDKPVPADGMKDADSAVKAEKDDNASRAAKDAPEGEEAQLEELAAVEEPQVEEPQSDEGESNEQEDTDAEQAEADPASASSLSLTEDYRASFVHGDKGPEYQKYIVLHDTESESDAAGVIAYWDGAGTGVAAHFVVNKDGSIVQCVPLDKITHHAGFGDTGHNAQYGVEDESRDDKVGTVPIGDWAADYGMNSYSVGIEMVHVGGSGDYPKEQLAAVDALIAHIDAYYGFESQIIDHKAWRSGNSDTSPEFAQYLANYQDHRTHS